MKVYDRLNKELKVAGVPDHVYMGRIGEPIDTLVNTKTSSYPYLNTLIGFLDKLSGNELEMVVRALTEKKNKEAVPYLLKIYERNNELSENNLWAVGNALYTIDDNKYYPEVLKLCKNKKLGIGRARLIGILARMKTKEAFDILIDGLTDPNIKGEAIEALGRFGDISAIPILEELSVDRHKYEFKAKNTALNRLNRIKTKMLANNS
jgi:HEAT repeat protein